MLKPFSRVDR